MTDTTSSHNGSPWALFTRSAHAHRPRLRLEVGDLGTEIDIGARYRKGPRGTLGRPAQARTHACSASSRLRAAAACSCSAKPSRCESASVHAHLALVLSPASAARSPASSRHPARSASMTPLGARLSAKALADRSHVSHSRDSAAHGKSAASTHRRSNGRSDLLSWPRSSSRAGPTASKSCLCNTATRPILRRGVDVFGLPAASSV